MTDLDRALAGLHATVAEFDRAALDAKSAWTSPPMPGKWFPTQLVEHVAWIMEESANVAAGAQSKFPTLPMVFRPIARVLVFRRILKRGAFLRMKAIPAFDPEIGPTTPEEGSQRIIGALAKFDQACRARAYSGSVRSTLFGRVSVADFANFQRLHVRHHLAQMCEARQRDSRESALKVCQGAV